MDFGRKKQLKQQKNSNKKKKLKFKNTTTNTNEKNRRLFCVFYNMIFLSKFIFDADLRWTKK